MKATLENTPVLNVLYASELEQLAEGLKWQLADTARDAWLLLGLFVVLLGCEWFLRKKWGLV